MSRSPSLPNPQVVIPIRYTHYIVSKMLPENLFVDWLLYAFKQERMELCEVTTHTEVNSRLAAFSYH